MGPDACRMRTGCSVVGRLRAHRLPSGLRHGAVIRRTSCCLRVRRCLLTACLAQRSALEWNRDGLWRESTRACRRRRASRASISAPTSPTGPSCWRLRCGGRSVTTSIRFDDRLVNEATSPPLRDVGIAIGCSRRFNCTRGAPTRRRWKLSRIHRDRIGGRARRSGSRSFTPFSRGRGCGTPDESPGSRFGFRLVLSSVNIRRGTLLALPAIVTCGDTAHVAYTVGLSLRSLRVVRRGRQLPPRRPHHRPLLLSSTT